MMRLARLLEQGVAEQVFVEARAVVILEGQIVFDAGPARPDSLFDLASLTKVVCSAAIACRLAARGVIRLDEPLSTWLSFPLAAPHLTLTDLAFHRSGLPAFFPFFAEVARRHPTLFDGAPRPDQAPTRHAVRAEVIERAGAVPVERTSPPRAVYSDVGFILLGEALSGAAGEPLDALFRRELAGPLGLDADFRPLTSPSGRPAVRTGQLRPREPAPGQEGLWTCPSWPSRAGEVDDDNAWVLGGVAGHAGLFATATAVARFGRAVLEGFVEPPGGRWVTDPLTPASSRAFGFDTPSLDNPSCGLRFGRKGPRGAIGHLGFTGTSLWIDLDRRLVVALLTNRVALGRTNTRIRAFRPAFHDAVLDALALT